MADVITRLRLDSREYDAKIERARSGLVRLSDELNRAGKSFKDADADQIKYVQSLGQMPTVAKTAKGAIAELTKAYTDLSLEYKKLSAEDKNSALGRGLKTSLDELRTRIQAGKKDLADISTELNDTGKSANNLQGVLGTLGSKFGISTDLLSGLTTGTIAYTAAIGAAATAVTAAAKALAEYNTELAQQDNATSVVTGLKGGDADSMTSMARALSKTYDVDFRQSIEAANTLMSQFGVTSAEAMKLLRDGMQGMIQGDGPKLLSMIQQFAPSFQSAGVSAAQLVAVIQNSEGGIFTDQNMQAIVMGIRNIRLMTKQTSEALTKMGLDGEQMSRQLNDGTITVFDALKLVANKLKDVDSNSQTAGQVMQAVFGRQGAMAGTNLAKAIDTLNTNLEETKRQTGEVGEAFAQLEKANERLEKAMREAFAVDGWQKLTTSIKTDLTDALTGVYRILGDMRKLLDSLGMDGESAFKKLADGAAKVALGISYIPIASTLAAVKGLAAYGSSEAPQTGISTQGIAPGQAASKQQAAWGLLPQYSVRPADHPIRHGAGNNEETKTPPPKTTTSKTKSDEVEGGIKGLKDFATSLVNTTESMAQLRTQLSEYQAARDTATNTADYAAAEQGIELTQRKIGAQESAIRLGVDTDSILAIEDQMQEELESMRENLPTIDIKLGLDTNSIKSVTKEQEQDSAKMVKNWQAAGSAIQAVGNAMNQIEDPAAKVLGTIAQAIASVALGYAQATVQAAELGPWAWIAFAAAGLATMITSIATIKSATKGGFAEGGIVPGNNFSGDMLRTSDYGINSGELILNKAQQNNIAQLLTDREDDTRDSQPYVSGEMIYLGLQAYTMRSGMGEIVTSEK